MIRNSSRESLDWDTLPKVACALIFALIASVHCPHTSEYNVFKFSLRCISLFTTSSHRFSHMRSCDLVAFGGGSCGSGMVTSAIVSMLHYNNQPRQLPFSDTTSRKFWRCGLSSYFSYHLSLCLCSDEDDSKPSSVHLRMRARLPFRVTKTSVQYVKRE